MNYDFGFLIYIKNEEFILDKIIYNQNSFQESLDTLKVPGNNAFYLLLKKENLLITFVPDNASVRDKMLYASSKGLLTKELGLGSVKWDISSLKELSYQGYLDFSSVNDDKPFTDRELEMQKVKNDLAMVDTSSNMRQGHIMGLKFKIDSKLTSEIQELKSRGSGGLVFVRMEKLILEIRK